MSIVVCIPGGVSERVLVDAGVEQARAAGQPLVLLQHVKVHDSGNPKEVDQEVSALERTRGSLTSLAAEVASDHGISCHARVLSSGADNPSSELLEAVRDEGATMLVIGLRSRSRVGKFLMGSTAQDLLLGSERRVLCVPLRREQA